MIDVHSEEYLELCTACIKAVNYLQMISKHKAEKRWTWL